MTTGTRTHQFHLLTPTNGQNSVDAVKLVLGFRELRPHGGDLLRHTLAPQPMKLLVSLSRPFAVISEDPGIETRDDKPNGRNPVVAEVAFDVFLILRQDLLTTCFDRIHQDLTTVGVATRGL